MRRRIIGRSECEHAIFQVSSFPFARQMLKRIGRRESLQLRGESRADDANAGADLEQRRDLALRDLAPAQDHAAAPVEIDEYRQVTHSLTKFYYSDRR